MKQCMHIEVRPHVEIQGVKMFSLVGLCCVGFINPIGIVAGVKI
jgi:hypothetical protein